MTAMASSISNTPRKTWFSKASGAGQPHIIWPMEKYISTRRMIPEKSRRFFSFGVSLSFRASSSAQEGAAPTAPAVRAAFFGEAPYPASVTARIMSEGEAVPSTPMELVRRLTEHPVTPGTLETAFSTLALQAAQLIPVIVY